jgi:hypothetical protein
MFEGSAVVFALRTAGILPALLFLRVLPIFKFAFLNPMPLDTNYHSINDPNGSSFSAQFRK